MAKQRGMMALIGALAGGSLYLLGLMIEAEWLAGRLALFAALLAGVFFGGLLVTTGPLRLARAAAGAAGVAVLVAGLVTLASLRFAGLDGVAGSALAVLSALTLALLPWPFLIASDGLGWRDYPSLFTEAWGIVVRATVALLFTGIVWLVVFLSNELLSLVGVTVIEDVLTVPVAAFLITGTVLGLAMAVVNELADVLSPGLVLRLFRLLLPVVLVVMAIFLIALPIRGFGTIFGSVSSALVLLTMVATATTLVTSALDQEDATATHTPVMIQSARVLAAITVIPAGIAAWAVWLRVSQYGWTPSRLLAATAAVLALGYGVFYLQAILRGAGWMERIRQANTWMALAMMAVAVLWLSVLSPEGISTRDQMARMADGRTRPEAIDLYALGGWGLAGQAAVAALKDMAASNPALKAKLAELDGAPALEPDKAGVQAALSAILPLQPASPEAQALRDRIFAEVEVSDLQAWLADCNAALPQGGPGCVLVVADFLPAAAGMEAMLIARSSDGYMAMEGFDFASGSLKRHSVTTYDAALPEFDEGARVIDQLQKGTAPISAVPLNQIALPGTSGLAFAP